MLPTEQTKQQVYNSLKLGKCIKKEILLDAIKNTYDYKQAQRLKEQLEEYRMNQFIKMLESDEGLPE
jgi:hypothetical protein